MTSLWNHFQEHVAALEPLPTLPPSLPDAHTDYPEPTAPAMDHLSPDTPDRPVRESSSPTPKRRRLARPPPEPPPLTLGLALIYRASTRPTHRSPLAAPEPPALHGLTWRARITDEAALSALVPRWTTLSNPWACRNAQRGGSLLVHIATPLCCVKLLCHMHCLLFRTVILKLWFFQQKKAGSTNRL